MKLKTLVIVSIVMLSMVTLTYAQGRGLGKGRGWGRGYCRYLQVQGNTPIAVEGKILRIEEFTSGTGQYGKGLHLFMNYNGKESEIHMGPAEWFNTQGFPLKKGDTIRVKAYQGLYNGNPALFATEISDIKGSSIVTLRDQYGAPMWRRSLDPSQRLYRNRRNGWGRGRGWSRGYSRGYGRSYSRGPGWDYN
jgi:hypothetical protein